jgi:hypothetical protein
MHVLEWNLAERAVEVKLWDWQQNSGICMCLNIEDAVKQHYEWQNSNINVRNWANALKDNLYSSWLEFMQKTTQECNLSDKTGKRKM